MAGGQQFGEFAEVTATVSGSVVTLRGNTPGVPFVVSVAETSASGTLTAQDADEGSRLTFAIDAPAAPAETATEQGGVDLDLLRLQTYDGGGRVLTETNRFGTWQHNYQFGNEIWAQPFQTTIPLVFVF